MPRPTRRYLKMWRSIIKPEMLGCPAISRTIPKNVCPQIPTVLRTLKDTLWLGGTEAFGNLLRFLSKLIPTLFFSPSFCL